MGAKYTATSVSGYNSSPPADDGSTSESNKIKWSTIKTKLPDPIKTALESIDTKLTTWAAYGPTSVAEATTIAASHNEKFIEVTSACTMTLTDASTLAAGWMAYIVNSSSGIVTIARATGGDTIDGSASNITIPSKESIGFVVNAAANGFLSFVKKSGLTLATMQASTSGTSIDFTGIPSGTKEIVVMMNGVSTNGSSSLLVQLGDSDGVETSGYVSSCGVVTTSSTADTVTSNSGALFHRNVEGDAHYGVLRLTLMNAATFAWVGQGSTWGGVDFHTSVAVTKSLSAELDRVRVTTVNGTDAFDAGTINIAYK